MTAPFRARAALAFVLASLLPLVVPAAPALAQDIARNAQATPPASLQGEGETPWIYEGSDVPRDPEWLWGKMDNGLRYAVRRNGVPPGQVSIRVRIDAGSLHETDEEQGYAHLIEHLVFRESKYLPEGQAIATWQRLGASFGSDTNAETSPTHTAYKLDLPGVSPASLEESFKLISGMVREPALSDDNLRLDVPIVLAEMRERGGAQQRIADTSRRTLFAGQRLAERMPIGLESTLRAATADSVRAFHRRWYRPENTVIVAAGDVDPNRLAQLIERFFGDWQVSGEAVAAPDFGDPVAPAGADPDNPVGEVAVQVEAGIPRSFTYAVMRPWRQVQDTIRYNEGLLMDALAQALINRRLEARARAGGSYIYAQVRQDDVSRSTDATFVSFAPLSEDWRTALGDVREVIADALATPPSTEEIERELAEFEVAFASSVEQRAVMPGSELADTVVQAVDIRETVAAPETVLQVFNSMRNRVTPELLLERTRALFTGDVVRSIYVTPDSEEADATSLAAALAAPVEASGDVRLAAQNIAFEDLPQVGGPGEVVAVKPLGVLGIEQVDFANGVKAILWANDGEPGRVNVKARFGAGWRAFDETNAPYADLGEMALIGSGLGELGQEELDRLSTGRKLGFDFAIEDAAFAFSAETRQADLADQLYLFAAKLAMPRWDRNPFVRARAASRLAYDAYNASPGGVLQRDLEYLLRGREARFRTADIAALDSATPEGFRDTWAPLLRQGPVEVMVFGDFDRDEAIEALRRTFGALEGRDPIPADVAARVPGFADRGEAEVLEHRGDASQAAALVAWPSGGGVAGLRESRQLQILVQLFNNRLLDEMRERAGAAYAPQVTVDWPSELRSGGTIMAIGQVQPKDVPVFFAAVDAIAADLATNPPGDEELARVTEPLRQLISRASTGNGFWMQQLEGASQDPRRIALLRSLLSDYSRTTPQTMQALATKYLTARPGWRLAVIPEGEELASLPPPAAAPSPAIAPGR